MKISLFALVLWISMLFQAGLCMMNETDFSEQAYGSAVIDDEVSFDLGVEYSDDLMYVRVCVACTSFRWCGVGFGSNVMAGTYAIVYIPSDDQSTSSSYTVEVKLDNPADGTPNNTLLTPTIMVESDMYADNVRTVCVIRAVTITEEMTDQFGDYFDFDGFNTCNNPVDIIYAFAAAEGVYWPEYHEGNRGVGTFQMLVSDDVECTTPSPTDDVMPISTSTPESVGQLTIMFASIFTLIVITLFS